MTKPTKLIKLAMVATGVVAFASGVQAADALDKRLPDYAADDGNDWLYNHAIAGKACPDEAVETGVDLFFVYPTLNDAGGMTVIDGFRGIDDATMRSATTNHHYQTAVCAFVDTARCFADMTHVYAPFYRQATVGTAKDCATNAQGQTVADADAKYLAKLREGPAYSDVTNALATYFAKWNDGRKLVLAGHSQGSAILRLVMRDYFTLPENRDKAKQIICSYQIGFGVSNSEMDDITEKTKAKGEGEGFGGIAFASGATDVGVVVSYNTMGEGSSGNSLLLPPDTIAINPITWSRSTDLADKDLNLGARTNVLGTTPDVVVPHLYGAQVVDSGFNRGEVVVCKELNDKVLGTNIMGTCSLHAYDYSAYWENLRANGYERGGKLAGYCKLCTTNFPAHLCVSNAIVNLTGSSLVVDPVAGTVWIPTNGFSSAIAYLVSERGYRIMFSEQETPDAPVSIEPNFLQANGEFLIPSETMKTLTVEYVQRAPDYADETGRDWLFNHDIAAKRYEGETAQDPGVDLFYLYPTSVYTNDDRCVDGVCDIDNPVLHGPSGAIKAWNQSAEVFGDFTRVYAPYYRQTPSEVEIPIGAQPDANAKMRQYWYKRAPYEDVTNALTHYFTKINPEGIRPFIFAGHSHGSGMFSLAMEHFFAEKPERKEWLKNMVACYAIGWGVSTDWEVTVNGNLDMYVATNATDAGVYVFWNTYGPNTNATECMLYPKPGMSAAGVNPITWTRTGEYAPASLNLGGWTADDSGAVRPGLYDASNNVANGTLICSSKDLESKYMPPLRIVGEHSLHAWDYKLYWGNLRANAYARYAAFAGLVEVETNGVPTVADTTWKVKTSSDDGKTWKDASVSPVDGKYYAPADATKVKLVYTLNGGEAESVRFTNGETSISFPMEHEGGAWVSTLTSDQIKAATKTGLPTLKLGVVAQRYPWNGTVDVNYKATYWPAGRRGAVEVTVGGAVTTNAFDVTGQGTVTGAAAVDLSEIARERKSKATFKAIVK